jgi:hypothetical protein
VLWHRPDSACAMILLYGACRPRFTYVVQYVTGFDNDLMVSAEDNQLGPLSRIQLPPAGEDTDVDSQLAKPVSHKALCRAVALSSSEMFTFHEARAFVVSASTTVLRCTTCDASRCASSCGCVCARGTGCACVCGRATATAARTSSTAIPV